MRLATWLFVLGACSGPRLPSTAAPPTGGPVPMPAFAVSAQTDQALELQAPWSLTASDGSGLVLTRVDARAVVQGALAFTELHLYFHNPEPRIREGTFSITLPPRAAVSRFAMETAGKWMEAEVVEKLRARRAYEDFLHRRQDPALLEKADGNQFTARVFPIPANADKHLVISFSQDLPGERYTLPLRGLPKIARFDARLSLLGVDGRTTEQVLAEHDWQPDRDFVSTAPVTDRAVVAGPLVAAQLAVGDAAAAIDRPAALTVLFDTSASRTLGFARQVAALDRMIAGLRARGDLRLQVLAYDQETRPIFDGQASAWGGRERDALLARGAAGASDLGQALGYVAAHGGARSRLLVFGDAVVTAGPAAADLVRATRQLRGLERVDVVLSGGIRDDGLATDLVRAGARPGAVLDADAGIDDVVAALGERMRTDVAVAVRGATWVYPRVIPSVRPGARVMVYAQLRAPRAQVEVQLGGAWHHLAVTAGTPALVERAIAAAKIDELERRLANAAPDAANGLRAEIARRSIAARVISSQTSMLVLETAADYERYGIARDALTDILEIGPRGLEQRHRKLEIADPVAHVAPPAKPEPKPRAKATAGADRRDQAEDAIAGKLEAGNTEEVAGASAGSAAGPSLSEPAPPPPAPPASPGRVAQDVARDAAPRRESRTRPSGGTAQRLVARPPAAEAIVVPAGDAEADEDDDGSERRAWPPKDKPAALQGELAEITRAIARHDLQGALGRARAWHEREPGNVLALIGLGETLEAGHDLAGAARAYGSIIDLFPGRADLRRFAGERLERIGAAARALAIDTYRRAVADRPDHLTGHRLLAYALLRAGDPAAAFDAILAGLAQDYPSGRFAGGDRVLRDDAGLIGAAYAAAAPGKRAEIARRLAQRGAALATAPSTRFILYWETDANDVDFHIQDARGGHAYYASKDLPSGGELYADITTGYGPECFAIPGVPEAGPYHLSLDYYSQGPMGYGMGLLQIVRHDGKGRLTFEDRPYVIMADHAYVDLGSFQ